MRRLILTGMIAALIASCGGEEPADRASYEIDEIYRRGPVSLRVALSSDEITIAEQVTMLLEIRAREGYTAELPRFGDKLEQFGIVDYETGRPELSGDTVVTRRTYELEPFLSGDYAIPPMTVHFRVEGDTIAHTVESDTLHVRVNSILPDDLTELEIRDIAGPAEIPADYTRIAVIATALAAVLAGLFVLWRRRRVKPLEARRIMAHETAYGALETLLSRGLVEQKRYREFTAEVADILRRYIEDRFGLRAPERTTEEFLAEAGAGLAVDEERKRILADFLLHSDLVKFAALEPSAEDVKHTFNTAKDFIDATRQEEVSGAARSAA